jgi:hypothetical protein
MYVENFFLFYLNLLLFLQTVDMRAILDCLLKHSDSDNDFAWDKDSVKSAILQILSFISACIAR